MFIAGEVERMKLIFFYHGWENILILEEAYATLRYILIMGETSVVNVIEHCTISLKAGSQF